MYDVNKVNRQIELFIFDVFIAIKKIKKVSSSFINVEKLSLYQIILLLLGLLIVTVGILFTK